MSVIVHCSASVEPLPISVPFVQRIFRFIASGLASFVAQLVVLLVLTRLGMPAVWANLIAIFSGTQANFLLSAHFTWADRTARHQRVTLTRWARFTAALSLTNLVNAGIFLLVQQALPLLAAAALGSSSAALLNFFSGDRLVFGVGKHSKLSRLQPHERCPESPLNLLPTTTAV